MLLALGRSPCGPNVFPGHHYPSRYTMSELYNWGFPKTTHYLLLEGRFDLCDGVYMQVVLYLTQWPHDGVRQSHLIFFLRHMSQAYVGQSAV